MIYDVVNRAVAVATQWFTDDLESLEGQKGLLVEASVVIYPRLDGPTVDKKMKRRGQTQAIGVGIYANTATTEARRQTEGRWNTVQLSIDMVVRGGTDAANVSERAELAIEAAMMTVDRMPSSTAPGEVLEVAPQRDSATVSMNRESFDDASCRQVNVSMLIPVTDQDSVLNSEANP